VRFAVVDNATGRHSGGWRVWTNKTDVYIAQVDLGDVLKVSLHDRVWRVAYTSEHWATGQLPNNAPGPGRTVWELDERPLVTDGVQHAWFIVVPPETLLRDDALGSDMVLIEGPPPDKAVNVNIWICEPGVTRRPEFAIAPSPLQLTDGRTVWVGIDLGPYDTTNAPHEKQAVGTMVDFSKPNGPGDTPGFVIRTVDVE
jgi:hypothetical protein